MVIVKEKAQCCGCTACYNVCPRSAIAMKADEEGFTYPVVDMAQCVECGLCTEVCPVQTAKKDDSMPLQAYILQTRDNALLNGCAAGGFFSSIAKHVAEQGGVVYGAMFDENMRVIHAGKTQPEEVSAFSSSKYVQSDMGTIFRETEQNLKKGKLVCFSGTPCQIEGLKNYLRKDYENLITVDVVCHGVPSPMLWEEYLHVMEKNAHSKVEAANFRSKTYGYRSGSLELKYKNRKKHFGTKRNDMMVKSFFSEISSRPSCYQCAFKKPRHASDLTMFDCKHAAALVEGLTDNDRGYTNLFVQTEKGAGFLASVKDLFALYPVDAETAISYDGIMVRSSAKAHKNRWEFYRVVTEHSLEEAVKKFIPISAKDRVMVSFRSVLYRMGILEQARNFMKKIEKKTGV